MIKNFALLKYSFVCIFILGLNLGGFFLEVVLAEEENEGHIVSLGLGLGGVIAPDETLESSPAASKANFDPGYSIKVSLGLTLAQKFMLEAEYLHTANKIDSLINPPTVTPLSVSDRTTDSFILNAIYRIETPPLGDEHWTRRGFFVYFGGGAGIAWQDYTVETLANGNDSSLVWQVLIGFEKMNPSRHLFASFPSPFLQYRFLHINEGDFGAFKADASLHILEFGFRFYGGLGD